MDWKYKIEFVKNGKEYYYNADGKLVFQWADDTVGYRRAELAPEVAKVLDRARSKHNYPTRSMIDNLISLQETAPLKAVNYVRYRLLGELRYIDVFGDVAEDRYKAERHYKTTEQLQNMITGMSAQLEDMQRIIFNMANQLNKSQKEDIRYRKVI